MLINNVYLRRALKSPTNFGRIKLSNLNENEVKGKKYHVDPHNSHGNRHVFGVCSGATTGRFKAREQQCQEENAKLKDSNQQLNTGNNELKANVGKLNKQVGDLVADHDRAGSFLASTVGPGQRADEVIRQTVGQQRKAAFG